MDMRAPAATDSPPATGVFMNLELVPFDESALFSADSEEDRATLVNAMQHDIRQPMHVIFLTHRELLNRLQDRECISLVRAAESAYGDLHALIEDALDAFRLFGLRSMRTEENGVSLGVLLMHLKEKHEQQAHAAGIALRVRPSGLFAVTDKRLLTRIVTNLVMNGITHSKASRLLVGARPYRRPAHARGRVEQGIQIEVLDNGRGIPAEDLRNIFRPGYRGRAATQDRAPGQGLGLFNVHGLVHRLNGRLLVRSRPGCTHFRVQLPCRVERERAAVAPPDASDTLAGRVVAIVDDQESVLEIMRMTFERMGAKVLAHTNDLSMLGELHDVRRCPDLFLLDFMIGSTYVDKVLKPLESKYGRDQLRIIVMTGQPSHPRLKSAEWAAAVPVIEKPMTESHMATIVEILRTGRPFGKADFP
jgi:CheY-like chemotaxis protein